MIIKHHTLDPINFDGLSIRDYTANADTQSSFAVIEVPPGIRHAESWSKRSDKYYYVTAGSIRFVLEGKDYELFSGDFCIVSKGERFWYENLTDQPATLVLVHTPSFDIDCEVFAPES